MATADRPLEWYKAAPLHGILLGGAVFRFGGQMMDGSIRGRLESLREGMLERSVV